MGAHRVIHSRLLRSYPPTGASPSRFAEEGDLMGCRPGPTSVSDSGATPASHHAGDPQGAWAQSQAENKGSAERASGGTANSVALGTQERGCRILLGPSVTLLGRYGGWDKVPEVSSGARFLHGAGGGAGSFPFRSRDAFWGSD